MPQLPHTSPHQHRYLSNTVPDSPRIGILAQIPKVGLSLTLILLLPPDILQFQIKVSDFGGKFGDMTTVMFKIGLGSTDDNIEVETDMGV